VGVWEGIGQAGFLLPINYWVSLQFEWGDDETGEERGNDLATQFSRGHLWLVVIGRHVSLLQCSIYVASRLSFNYSQRASQPTLFPFMRTNNARASRPSYLPTLCPS
jgi:hypothetical protein